jgi:2'-5' RNA ligase
MRVFLGINISEDLKHKIINVQDRFSNFDIKFVEPENLHFNLKFFKEIDEENLEKIKKFVEEISKQFEPFEIRIVGVGAFPNKNYVKVIWLGVKEGYQALTALAEAIENSLESLGFEGEEKFVPHLTLGRVRSGRNKNELLILLRGLEDIEIGKMKVDEIKLFQSVLTPNGPIYKEVFNIKL